MSTFDAQEIPLDQLGEIAGGADTPEHRQKLEREKAQNGRQKRTDGHVHPN